MQGAGGAERRLMSEQDRIIAHIREYGDFTAAIRKWITELDTNYACVNDLAGLQDGYLAKLIAKTPVRNFGPTSLSTVLGALCLKLILVVDTEKLEAMRPRYVPRKKHAHANDDMPTKRTHYLRKNSAFMSLLRQRGVLLISPQRRKQIARHAALIRWRNGHTSPVR
jgi:hypothetical protein